MQGDVKHKVLAAVSLAAWALLASPLVAKAADAPDPAPIPLTQQERAFMMQMCETARWANRQQFDQSCDLLKKRFDEADKKAATIAAPPATAAPAPKP